MMNANSLSKIKLEDDFNELLEENRKFMQTRSDFICAIHHIKNNRINQIEQEIKKCRLDNADKYIKKLPDMLDELVILGIAKSTVDLNYSLTRLGEQLRAELNDPFAIKRKD